MSHVRGNTELAFAKVWHHVSARDRKLGHLAVRIATTLMGKHKPGIWDPSNDCGDYVVVTDAEDVFMSESLKRVKQYTWYTTRSQPKQERSWAELMQSRPELVLRSAVAGMLPKNRLKKLRLDRLYIFMKGKDTVPPTILANCVQTFGISQSSSSSSHQLPGPVTQAALSLVEKAHQKSFPSTESLVNIHANHATRIADKTKSLVPLWTTGRIYGRHTFGGYVTNRGRSNGARGKLEI